MNKLLKYFLPYIMTYKKEFVLALLGMIAVAIGTTLSAHLLKPVLDDVFIRKDEQMLMLIPFAIIGVFMLKSLGRYVQTYYTVYIGDDIVRQLRNKLSSHLMHQDIDYLNKMRSGELLSRVTGDLGRIQEVVSSMIPTLMVKSMLIITLTGYVIYQSPKLAFYFLVIMPLALFPLRLLAKKMKKYSRRSQESNADLASRLTEIFNNIEVIKANSSQAYEDERFAKENMNFFTLAIKQMKINALVGPTLEVFGSIAIALAIYVGALQVIHDEITVGTFFAFVTALFMLYDPIKVLSNVHNRIQDAVAATERMNELFDTNPTIISGKTLLGEVQSVHFKSVSLVYEEKEALRNINLEADKGKVYALVGDSGAGKSSFINLLVRFYDPTSGELKINGENIKNYTLHSLHQKIAYVTQRIYIFQDTIAANVAYGSEADEAKVIEALKKAQAWEFVQEMKEGIYTILDEFGVNLSGGQRQRIALARALYKSPEILILDEATSALDNKSEKAIQKALETLKDTLITFVVAHRLSTVENADTILLFDSGEIVARGSYNELLENSEVFRKLANKIEE
ncbi:MAG TPA: ABC transporter ATP-binding protein [Sulfurovum sp.]|nr:MAG: ABC transporter permease [Sulfurovum sp. 35-42-20]OYZ25053.1 MAG: ABC transporter permease [Sulfurovum sp. 16-42-52]OZA44820.1 MAG: ABC transporter permease [Sulfurovum sp. 17-42-90]OZA61101.1 MAG: ABC transporter permease [Sulfurovum sp. 39-42-12]HQR73591.1 ABC transporter ATP-binding protein [Sulfurovum sp.]